MVNFHESSWKSRNLYFNGLILSKAYTVLDEKVQKSYVSWQSRVTQSLKKNRLFVPKMTSGICWVSMRAVWQVCKSALCCATFVESRREVMCHNTEEWCRIWGGTDVWFENDMRNLANFTGTLKNLKTYTMKELFWPRYIMFELKNYNGVMSHDTEGLGNIFKKIHWWFEK